MSGVRWLWLVLLLAAAPGAQAQTVLEIAGGAGGSFRIAVVPFAWEVDALRTLDPARLVEESLARYSGFDTVARDAMPSLPTEAGDIVRWDWLAQGVDFVLTARVRQSDDRARVWIGWSLYDVSQGKVVLAGTEPDRGEGFRSMLHHIGSRVHWHVFGVPGAHGSRFVYVSVVPGDWGRRLYRLVQADADGRGQKILFSSNEPILSPSWSPDGRQVAFSTASGNSFNIRVLDLATGRTRYLGSWGGSASEPVFSPRGDYLALTLSRDANPDIHVYHLRSGELTRLTEHFAIDAEPFWAPDGGSILFTSDRSGTAQLYRFNLLSGEIRRLTFFDGNDGQGRVLPGGRRAVFVRSQGDFSRLALLDLQTLSVRMLTEAGLYDSPGVAPDGNTVLYSSTAGRSEYLSGLRLRGGGSFELTGLGEGVRAPAWSPLYR